MQIPNVCKCLLNADVYLCSFHDSLDYLSLCYLNSGPMYIPGAQPEEGVGGAAQSNTSHWFSACASDRGTSSNIIPW